MNCIECVSCTYLTPLLIHTIMTTYRKVRIFIGTLLYFGTATLFGGWIGFVVVLIVAIFSSTARKMIGVETQEVD